MMKKIKKVMKKSDDDTGLSCLLSVRVSNHRLILISLTGSILATMLALYYISGSISDNHSRDKGDLQSFHPPVYVKSVETTVSVNIATAGADTLSQQKPIRRIVEIDAADNIDTENMDKEYPINKSESPVQVNTIPVEEDKEETAENSLNVTVVVNLEQMNDFIDSQQIDIATDQSNKRPRVKPDSCLRYNSLAWLKGHRVGNLDDPLMNDDHIRSSIIHLPTMLSNMDISHHALEQTICFDDSRFRNTTELETDDTSLRLWSVRLAYLAIFYHQHIPALQESQARFESPQARRRCEGDKKKFKIGKMDYECPGAKFIVVSLGDIGLGANMRSGAVAVLISALLSDRVAVIVNNAPRTVHNKFLKRPWQLTSCDRRDAQCFFMPMTPCTLTVEDINQAYVLDDGEHRRLFRKGEKPKGHDDEKVWLTTLDMFPVLFTPYFARKQLYNHAKTLLSHLPKSDPRLPILHQATELILQREPNRPGYNFAGSSLKVNHALLYYAMRPNIQYAQELDTMMKEIIPPDLDRDQLFGLPIRGRCLRE
jgi:hypothetical protein